METPLFETQRLALAPVLAEELPLVLEVFTSNPAYVELMEGPAGYTLAQLQRDWQVAQTSGRTMLAIRRRADQSVVGAAEFLDAHPNDDRPWLGLLIIRGDLRRQGYGSEALKGLLDYGARARGWPLVRIAVNEPDQAAMHFWQQQGFRPYRRLTRRLPGGETPTVCMERDLSG